MHLRRAILLFALVLGLAGLAAAVSPSRQAAEPTVAPPLAAPGRADITQQIAFGAGQKRVRRVREGQDVVVSVFSTVGGVATIPRLGLTASIAPAAPAQFDLLAPSRGRYDVLVMPSGSTSGHRVGTLVSRP